MNDTKKYFQKKISEFNFHIAKVELFNKTLVFMLISIEEDK